MANNAHEGMAIDAHQAVGNSLFTHQVLNRGAEGDARYFPKEFARGDVELERVRDVPGGAEFRLPPGTLLDYITKVYVETEDKSGAPSWDEAVLLVRGNIVSNVDRCFSRVLEATGQVQDSPGFAVIPLVVDRVAVNVRDTDAVRVFVSGLDPGARVWVECVFTRMVEHFQPWWFVKLAGRVTVDTGLPHGSLPADPLGDWLGDPLGDPLGDVLPPGIPRVGGLTSHPLDSSEGTTTSQLPTPDHPLLDSSDTAPDPTPPAPDPPAATRVTISLASEADVSQVFWTVTAESGDLELLRSATIRDSHYVISSRDREYYRDFHPRAMGLPSLPQGTYMYAFDKPKSGGMVSFGAGGKLVLDLVPGCGRVTVRAYLVQRSLVGLREPPSAPKPKKPWAVTAWAKRVCGIV